MPLITVPPTGGAATGTQGVDQLEGSAFDDVLNALGGVDNVFAGAGNDRVRGGAGVDFVFGEAGNDLLLGNQGADNVVGGTGRDTLRGGGGADDLFGGRGADTINGNGGADEIIYNLGDGRDVVNGGAGTDTIKVDGAGFEQSSVDLRNRGFVVTGANGRVLARVTIDDFDPSQLRVTGGANPEVSLGGRASGTIAMADGGRINFSNVEILSFGNAEPVPEPPVLVPPAPPAPVASPVVVPPSPVEPPFVSVPPQLPVGIDIQDLIEDVVEQFQEAQQIAADLQQPDDIDIVPNAAQS